MAIPFLNDIEVTGGLNILAGKGNLDLEKNQLLRAVIHADSGEPTSPAEGQVCHNTSKTDTVNGNGKFGYRSSTKWVYPDMEKSVYDTDNDGVVNEAEEADTLDGQHGSYYLNRAYHTGSPSTDVSWANHKITNLADPTGDQDAANKRYVDGLVQGLSWKTPVKCATTANITLSGSQTIDGYSPGNGERVLVKDQTASSQNGIYLLNSGGSWTRADDANAWAELVNAAVFIEKGTTQPDTAYVCTSNSGGVIDSSAVTFVQFGGGAEYTAGDGLSKTGNEFDVNVDDESIEIATDILQVKLDPTGALSKSASGLSVNIDGQSIQKNVSNQLAAKLNVALAQTDSGIDVQVDGTTIGVNVSNKLYVKASYPAKYSEDITPSTYAKTVTHSLNTKAITVSVYDKTSGIQVYPQITISTDSAIVVTFKETSTTVYTVVVIG